VIRTDAGGHAPASTEPPSEDGGELGLSQLVVSENGMLQRSRRPKTAESKPRQLQPWRYGLLQRSRRPKTAERGGTTAGLRGKRCASTEPPSEDGGEILRLGAPSLSAPKLQRSRRPKTAERIWLLALTRQSRPLQRSRRPKTAESTTGVLLIRLLRRASTEPPSEDGGEFTSLATSFFSAFCFNGAAVRRRRREGGRNQSAEVSTGFNGAAVRRRRRVGGGAQKAESRRVASTEPPSEDGGETESRPSLTAISLLQRSRRPKTAESTCVFLCSRRIARFNGAAVRRRRRVRKTSPCLWDQVASTEPPSEDGGEIGYE